MCYTSVLCEHLPGKSDPDHTCITIYSTNVKWDWDEGTKTASLDIFKFVINSVLSRKGAQFAAFDIGNFYLDTPMQNRNILRSKSPRFPKNL